MPRGIKTGFVEYTIQMDDQIDKRRISKLYTWKDFYKVAWLKGWVTTMDYRRIHKRISYTKLKVLIKLGALSKESIVQK